MRPIMFSRVYPKYHPKAGQPTCFVEKIMAGLADVVPEWKMYDDFVLYDWHQYYNAVPKFHTIRAGNRWKVGDFFSPRIWSEKAYKSPQIEFAPPIKIEKIWQFIVAKEGYRLSGNGWTGWLGLEMLSKIASNDGLTVGDLEDWFAPYGKKEPEECQIICWNEKIEYIDEFPNTKTHKDGTK